MSLHRNSQRNSVKNAYLWFLSCQLARTGTLWLQQVSSFKTRHPARHLLASDLFCCTDKFIFFLMPPSDSNWISSKNVLQSSISGHFLHASRTCRGMICFFLYSSLRPSEKQDEQKAERSSDTTLLVAGGSAAQASHSGNEPHLRGKRMHNVLHAIHQHS